jgi:hypothetical protein
MTSVRFLEHPRTSWQHFFTCVGVKDSQKTILLSFIFRALDSFSWVLSKSPAINGNVAWCSTPERPVWRRDRKGLLPGLLAREWDGTPRPLYILIFLRPNLANLFYKSSVLIVYDRSGSIAPFALKPLRRCLRGPEMSMHPAVPTHAIMIDQRASDL